MTTVQALITVAVIAAGTFLTRSLPFLLFPSSKETPRYIVYLGIALPCATIGMLVVYCLKDVNLTAWPNGLPEAIAIVAVAAIQYWKRSTLLSIVVGTLLYMLLVQVVFV